MFGIGVTEIVIIAGVLMISGLASASGNGRRFSSTTLVLRIFRLNAKPGTTTGPVVDISGRTSGLIGWILTVVGLSPETSLTVDGREVRSVDSSLFGQKFTVVPLGRIASVHCAYIKPIGYFFLGSVFAFGGLFRALTMNQYEKFATRIGVLVIGLLLGLVFFVLYFLMKKVAIYVVPFNGSPIGLTFKRSVIENVPVDIEQARKVIQVINNLIVASANPNADPQQIVDEPTATVTREPAMSANSKCGGCGQELDTDARFCTSCGRSR